MWFVCIYLLVILNETLLRIIEFNICYFSGFLFELFIFSHKSCLSEQVIWYCADL